MPSAVLSDGKSSVNFNNEADRNAAIAHGEDQLTRDYAALAYSRGAPVTAGNFTYSPGGRHDNNIWGNIAAYANSENAKLFGNSSVGGAAQRIASTGLYAAPVVGWGAGLYDLGASGYNAAKEYLAPSLGQSYELPTVLGTVRSALGVPEQPADESETGRIAEAVASGFRPGSWGQIAKGLLTSGAAQAGGDVAGDVGERYFGQNAGPLARFFGSLATGSGVPTKLAQKGVAKTFANEDASSLYNDMRTANITPSFAPLATETGRRLDKALSSVPIVGAFSGKSRDQTVADVGRVFKEDVPNSLLPAGAAGVGPTDSNAIGNEILTGTRQGAANLTHQAENTIQGVRNQIGETPPTNMLTPLLNLIGRQNRMSTSGRAAVDPARANLAEDINRAQQPITQGTFGQTYAPGQVPFGVALDARTNIGKEVKENPALAPTYKDMTTQLENAAGASSPPGVNQRQQFIDADNYYKYVNNPQFGKAPALEKIGGEPQGGYDALRGPGGATQPVAGTNYFGGKSPDQAYSWWWGNRQSDENLKDFYDPSIVPPENSSLTSAKIISTLGDRPTGWRPDHAAIDWMDADKGISPDVKSLMFGSGGGVHPGIDRLNAAGRVGIATVVPPERSGLTAQMGATYATIKGIEAASRAAEEAAKKATGGEGPISWLTGTAAGVGAGTGAGAFLNAPSTLAEMAGQPSWSIAGQLYGFAPKAAVANQDVQGWPNIIPAHQYPGAPSAPNVNPVPAPPNSNQANAYPQPPVAPAPLSSDDLARKLFQSSAIPGLQ